MKKCNCTPFEFRHFSKEVNLKWRSSISTFILQETLCTPLGRECYDSITQEDIKCVLPCEGIFADVDKTKTTKAEDDNEVQKKVIDEYQMYKHGFNNSGSYQIEIPGKFHILASRKQG